MGAGYALVAGENAYFFCEYQNSANLSKKISEYLKNIFS